MLPLVTNIRKEKLEQAVLATRLAEQNAALELAENTLEERTRERKHLESKDASIESAHGAGESGE